MMQGKRWVSILVMTLLTMMAFLLMAGCNGDDDNAGPFALNECRLDNADCRLQ